LSEDPITARSALSRVESGIAGLDTILGGGFLEGGIYIVQGHPGAGKTILANQICFHHAARDGRALYVTLLAETHARMLAHIAPLRFFDPAAIPERISYVSGFSALEGEGLAGLLALLRRTIIQHGATLLVLDGLMAAQQSAASELDFKKFINALQTQAGLAGCTVFLLTSGGELKVAPEHTMVDGVLLLESVLQGWRAERHLQIYKSRGIGALRGRHSFRIGEGGLEVFPRIEALYARSAAPEAAPAGRRASGLPGLDAMIGGGLVANSTTMLLGPAGIGKTVAGLQFLGESSAAEPGLMLGFFEDPRQLRVKADRLGLKVGPLMDAGAVEVMWQPTTEGLLDEVFQRLIENVARRRVGRVFIDGLEGMHKVALNPDRVAHLLAALAAEFRARGVATMLSAECELAGGIEGLPMSNLSMRGVSGFAENTVVMRFIERGPTLHRVVAVLKMRDSGFRHEAHAFDITDRGIVIDAAPDRASRLLNRPLLVPGSHIRPSDLLPDGEGPA